MGTYKKRVKSRRKVSASWSSPLLIPNEVGEPEGEGPEGPVVVVVECVLVCGWGVLWVLMWVGAETVLVPLPEELPLQLPSEEEEGGAADGVVVVVVFEEEEEAAFAFMRRLAILVGGWVVIAVDILGIGGSCLATLYVDRQQKEGRQANPLEL